MGLSSNQARLNSLTMRKSDLEYRLMMVSQQNQVLATKQADAVSKKAAALESFLNSESASDITVSFTNTQAYAEYETAMAQLEIADNKLTQQQKAIETEYQAVTAEEEEIKKLVDSNVKKSFGYFN